MYWHIRVKVLAVVNKQIEHIYSGSQDDRQSISFSFSTFYIRVAPVSTAMHSRIALYIFFLAKFCKRRRVSLVQDHLRHFHTIFFFNVAFSEMVLTLPRLSFPPCIILQSRVPRRSQNFLSLLRSSLTYTMCRYFRYAPHLSISQAPQKPHLLTSKIKIQQSVRHTTESMVDLHEFLLLTFW